WKVRWASAAKNAVHELCVTSSYGNKVRPVRDQTTCVSRLPLPVQCGGSNAGHYIRYAVRGIVEYGIGNDQKSICITRPCALNGIPKLLDVGDLDRVNLNPTTLGGMWCFRRYKTRARTRFVEYYRD